MRHHYLVNKPIGMTPLELLSCLRQQIPQLKDEKLAYSGRLDPMAEGLMVVLTSEGIKSAHVYKSLSKTYRVEILFGMSTDTYDQLGLIIKKKQPPLQLNKIKIEKYIRQLKGSLDQPYPPFSSPKVKGKSLFTWAKEGKLDQITIPSKKVTLHSVSKLSWDEISSSQLLSRIKENIAKVNGDFRQEQVLDSWTNTLSSMSGSLPILRVEISCSSGTYMRSLAHQLGASFQQPALALRILRTQVGPHKLTQAINLDPSLYD